MPGISQHGLWIASYEESGAHQARNNLGEILGHVHNTESFSDGCRASKQQETLSANSEPFREDAFGPIIGFPFHTTLAVARICYNGLLRDSPTSAGSSRILAARCRT